MPCTPLESPVSVRVNVSRRDIPKKNVSDSSAARGGTRVSITILWFGIGARGGRKRLETTGNAVN